MKKNLKGCVDLFAYDEPQIVVDMNQYDLIERSGMTPDLTHKKSAHMSAAWRFSEKTRVAIPVGGVDLSGYRYLTFSLFSVGGAGGSFCLMFDSSLTGEGKSGYDCTLPITKDGWNSYRVELPFLRAVGEPCGWDRVESICFDCVAGGQANASDTVLYIDHLFGWAEFAPPLYASMPELKGAAVFSKSGNFSIVDRKRIANTPDGADAKPFERDGILWLPMAPVAAGIAHAAVVDNRAFTLSFTYRRKKYAFSGNSDCMTVNGEAQALGFYPAVLGGTLFFPADFVREFFHWRQCFVDPMGLVVLSNRRNVFDSARDESVIWQLIADTVFLRPSAERILNDLHRRFPNPMRGRLLATFDELVQLRRDAKSDPALKEYVNALKMRYGTKSAAYLAEPCTDPAQLCETAEKLIAFSMLYRVSGDKQYAERCAAECEALAAMDSWEGASVQSVGEIAMGMAIAYDWCHHVFSEGRKAVIERGLLRNAMRPMLEYYDGKRRMWRAGGVTSAVVNAGMLAVSLALADIYPQTAYKLLDRILRNAEPCYEAFAPDGGYAVGVGAWEQSSRALALIAAMLQKGCGTDYGFGTTPGFAATAYFPIYAETARGAWNYHDMAASSVDTSLSYLFARQNQDPVPAWMRRQQLLSGQKHVHPFDILFYTPVDDRMTPHLPLDAVYRKAGLAMMRAGWTADAAFVGLHGGRNHEIGGDLDAGSILLEMGGERFFVDTGKEETLPMLLRRRAMGQNTVTVDPAAEPAPDQNPDAIVPLTEMRSVNERAYAVVDMTSVSDVLLRAKRGVLLTENRTVAVVQDEMTLAHPAEVVWSVWTRAEVKLNASGRTAMLTQNGKTLVCKLSGVGYPARFETEQTDGSDLTRITVRVSVKEKLRMAVTCSLANEDGTTAPKQYELMPISKWCEM